MCTCELCKLTLVPLMIHISSSLKTADFKENRFLKAKDEKNCGDSRGACGIVRMSDCNDEIRNHLISCHLSKETLSENELILAMAGFFNLPREDVARMWICFRYRHTLGKFWRSSKVTCQYPQHIAVKISGSKEEM